MEDQSSIIRKLINDLLRSLSAALVHVDDLIMKIKRNSDEFSDAMLTNEQLSRSVELFLDLRSECNYFLDQLSVNKTNSLEKLNNSTICQLKHNLNEALGDVLGSFDLPEVIALRGQPSCQVNMNLPYKKNFQGKFEIPPILLEKLMVFRLQR